MASALKGVSILVVEDDPDALDVLTLGLGAVGAIVRTAGSAEIALTLLETWRPDVILCDIQLPGVDGYRFLELLRANPHLRTIPAAALTGVAGLPREHIPNASFEKHLTKPSKLPAIVMALATLYQQDRPEPSDDHPSAKLRDLLAQLNTATSCRYTSVLQFGDNDLLTSIWTYDRLRPKTDPFPLGLPVHASYCVLVREARAMFVIENAATDPRTAADPKQDLACYLGVPLFRSDGTMFGTVCCYDPQPREVEQAARDALAAAARRIEPLLEEMFAPVTA